MLLRVSPAQRPALLAGCSATVHPPGISARRRCVQTSRCCSSSGDGAEVTAADVGFMELALAQARRGEGLTHPNPAVGCVLVQGERIVGEGFHPKAGMPHAEVYALRGAGKDAAGSTAYVTLEPCNHFGRTPPCSRALVDAGVSRVVVAVLDPNPLVAGEGVKTLQGAGVTVAVGCCEQDAYDLNEEFMTRMKMEAAAKADP